MNEKPWFVKMLRILTLLRQRKQKEISTHKCGACNFTELDGGGLSLTGVYLFGPRWNSDMVMRWDTWERHARGMRGAWEGHERGMRLAWGVLYILTFKRPVWSTWAAGWGRGVCSQVSFHSTDHFHGFGMQGFEYLLTSLYGS